jgi:hypothetical protein
MPPGYRYLTRHLPRKAQVSAGGGAAPSASFPPSAESGLASDGDTGGRTSTSKEEASTTLGPSTAASSLWTSAKAASSSPGIEKRGYSERILLSEGSGPRALLLIRGSKVAPCGVRQPPQSTQAPSPLLIRGSKAGPTKGFDSRPRACRVRDDSGYVRYMAEARAVLPRYLRTFLRPAGTICNGIPPEGGTEPLDPIKWVRVQQILCRYFWSAPLGH